MSIRFRKSVKICKGVTINFSKSGASLSLGGRGYGVTLGGNGAHAHVGIPGTGLSYNTKIGGSGSSRSRSSGRPAAGVPEKIGARMDDQGKIIVEDSRGAEITSPAVLRRIRATADYREQVARLEAQRSDRIDAMVRDAQEENERYINICRYAAVVDPLSRFESRLSEPVKNEHVMPKYPVPAPTKEGIRAELEREAETKVTGLFFLVGQQRRRYVEENLEMRYSQALDDWEKARDSLLASWKEERLAADRAAAQEHENQKGFMRALIDGEESAVCEVFDSWIDGCELPVEMNVSYDWNQGTGTMLLDVDLPEIEDLAQTRLVKTDAGNLKEKKKTQEELRVEYSRLVFGLAVFVVSHAFNVSPAIRRILISAYTQRRDKEGDLNDDYIYSIRFTRDMFEQRDVSRVDPREFCLSAENRCNMTSTSLFRPIVPYDGFE